MTSMLRKQIYLSRDQDVLLKLRAREAGVTEAHLIREALEAQLRYQPVPQRSLTKWQEERKFIQSLIDAGPVRRTHVEAGGSVWPVESWSTPTLWFTLTTVRRAKNKLFLRPFLTVWASGLGAISAQVLSEFFVAVTRRIRQPLTLEQAAASISNLCFSWPVYAVTEMIVCEAVRGVREHRLSFWDARIWASARLNQAGVVLREDFSHDQVIEGIRFLNPFLPGFPPDIVA